MESLDGRAWRARAAAHRVRIERWTLPHRERRRRHETHPVMDFLFTYYSLRPVRLEEWHPGPGVLLGDAEEFLDRLGYVRDGDGVRLDVAALPERIAGTASFVRALLVATASRPARLGCFGLHEWAMVYRSDAPRHDAVPLRLGAAGTDAVVEQLPVHCTHHDAFRFFTAAARPLNALTPEREDQVAHEQPGCLHATMDLYKWAYKLAPVTPSELLADCFALAVDVRELDMRASPYDLADLGYPPVAIETPAGRAEYARAQAGFAGRAAPLRSHLVAVCDELLA
ncbi:MULTISPECIES: 3-methyladenine DNA glycosylase [unclassified Pseudonocardia]|uniref:3-methyladenine DNA glycosylase n=1 Tax=unclassified Pseudonocardia TaxID=2619320 RepID=UPI00095AB9B1|nr:MULTISPECIES: 3-methyladenine DNA glycosylase [unclassified Pseudonocardia]MBN9098437.1 3-methyladenine DNA glycosylase [Pseudonocardia sp.]OJY40463.1 MAG: 3-methyladenine DNA glycosylase [Pseudonocardia sp. 73-21]